MQVRATGLSFAHLGAATLFENLGFDVRGGDLVALTGPSGSGKSTLLSLLGGWLWPTAGTIERVDVDRIALVAQNPYGVPGRTALDHVCLPLVARGLSRDEANRVARRHLARLKLDYAAERPYRMLSGGERQRMLLARALASEPDMLLVDEPTAQLDAAAAAEVCDALAALERDGVIVFVGTHDSRVVNVCSTVVDLLTAPPSRPGGEAPRGGDPWPRAAEGEVSPRGGTS